MTVLHIDRLGRAGDGVAPGPVFVPLSLPGEEVAGDIADGRIAAPRIVTPSADRVAPRCRHFRSCGGCALQHASDAFVEGWKADQVGIALAAHGLSAPIRAVHTSPAGTRRRAVFSARRTKKGAQVGFHARAAHIIVEIPDCKVVRPEILSLIPHLETLVGVGASRRGELSLTVTWSAAGADVAASGGHDADGPLRVRLAEIAGRAGLARLTWNGEIIVQARAPAQDFDGIACVPPPGAFLQATQDGEAALLSAIRLAVGEAGRVVDLFAGCGTFALPLARQAEVHAVESEAGMLAALDTAWRHAPGLKRVTTEARDLFRRPMLPAEMNAADAVVIDPPRAGAEAQSREIAASAVRNIAFVSCNPASFARDAAILVAAGFGIDWIEVVDQFRWSPHIELAARLSR